VILGVNIKKVNKDVYDIKDLRKNQFDITDPQKGFLSERLYAFLGIMFNLFYGEMTISNSLVV
jgi:hypothetical protein